MTAVAARQLLRFFVSRGLDRDGHLTMFAYSSISDEVAPSLNFPMDNSPFTYNDIKNGTLNEVHNVGELWAATLFDIRKVLGAAVTEQLVVTGMKLTPCNPSMLNARDGILQADANINGGANHCAIFRAFAARQMGTGASSPSDASTTAIVTSTDVPPGC